MFPIIIILLVPFRLLVMNRMRKREYLRYVDAWGCRDGTPEDDEDRNKGILPTSRGSNAEDIELDVVDRASSHSEGGGALTPRASGGSQKSKRLEVC